MYSIPLWITKNQANKIQLYIHFKNLRLNSAKYRSYLVLFPGVTQRIYKRILLVHQEMLTSIPGSLQLCKI
jgi:hypothetical protein